MSAVTNNESVASLLIRCDCATFVVVLHPAYDTNEVGTFIDKAVVTTNAS